jgi:hypothetical protein
MLASTAKINWTEKRKSKLSSEGIYCLNTLNFRQTQETFLYQETFAITSPNHTNIQSSAINKMALFPLSLIYVLFKSISSTKLQAHT